MISRGSTSRQAQVQASGLRTTQRAGTLLVTTRSRDPTQITDSQFQNAWLRARKISVDRNDSRGNAIEANNLR